MSIWPLTAEPPSAVGGVPLTVIAERFGTPAYVLDEAHVRHRCREYLKALHPHRVAYAGKAFLCRAMARWVDEEGLWLDRCSVGELALARAVGFPPDRILLHGNGKSPVTVVGHHCEAGDVIAADVPLPADIRPGDLLAVPCTGAYRHSMASNYNQVARPPVIAVRGGRAWPLVRRETAEDLIRRDVC